MSLFNSTEKTILDFLFGSGSPASYDLALSSTAPAEDGTNITEPSGGGYSRLTITNNATNFPASPVGGPKTNGTTFQFPTATASWGAALTHWVLFNGLSTPVIWGTLSPSKVVDAEDALRILSGQMTITCD
jgi:hypothetical protein